MLSPEGAIAAELARDDVNAAGGIHGRPLELRIMPMAQSASAALAIAAAESLAADPRVAAVVGHSNSSATLAASQIYNARRLVHLAPTSSAPLLSQAGPYTFQMVASDVHQASFLMDAVRAVSTHPRVVLLFVNDDYGRGLQQALRARMAHAGLRFVYEAPVSGEAHLVNPDLVVRAIAQSQPDIVIWVGRAGSLERLLPELRRARPSIRILSSDGMEDAISVQNPGGVFTGVRYVRFVPPGLDSPAISALGRRFAGRSQGLAMTSQAVLAYDAVMLYADALRASAATRDQVRDYLVALGRGASAYDGLTGRIAFDSTGAAHPRYVLTEITAGGLRAVAVRDDP